MACAVASARMEPVDTRMCSHRQSAPWRSIPISSLPTARRSRPTCFWTASMRPSARFSAQVPGSIRQRLSLATTSRCWKHDAAAMDRLVTRIKESSEPHLLQHAQSLAAARTGQLGRARTLAREAFDAAEGRGLRETAAVYASAAAVWEAFSGNQSAARQRAVTALGMSNGRDVSYAGAFALALAGDITRSEALANDLERQYPRDTLVKFTYVPTLRALAATRAQPAGHGHRTAAGERSVRACYSGDGLQLLLWKPVPRLRPWSGVRCQRAASAWRRRSFRRSSTIRD